MQICMNSVPSRVPYHNFSNYSITVCVYINRERERVYSKFLILLLRPKNAICILHTSGLELAVQTGEYVKSQVYTMYP